ncbi:MAG: efflux RND transporter permease subunit [Rhodobacteraceae bacterium]|nr:efflux RND transporter permease subunit [Paracoccaceae bacterium]
MFLTRISISQPVFTTMMMLAVLAFGLIGWRAIPIDRFPAVDYPVVAVLTPYSGAAPESVESDVTRIVEDELSTLAGIDRITSTSSQGHSTVVVLFTLETDSAAAVQDVRDRIALITPALPSGAEAPQVVRFNPTDDPVVTLALSSATAGAGRLSRLAEDVVVPRLTALPGVGSASLIGGVEDQVSVLLDPDLLRAHGLGVADIRDALAGDNLSLPAGALTRGARTLQLQLNAEARDPRELSELVVARHGEELIRLRDVATVTRGLSDPDSLAFNDGDPALVIEVIKADGANTVALAHTIETLLEQMNREGLAGSARLDILTNQAVAIEQNYHTVRSTLYEGAILAVLIVFLFLNSWRSTVITALTLPISFLGTLAVISLLGFTLNMMTMLALTLSVGILIDDAIVVRENITRHLAMGKDHHRAALDGTAEIGLAVVATTLALCAVFLPLAFMQGIVGRFFVQFGVTVTVSVLISLFVSFTLDPMLSSVWHDPQSQPGVQRRAFGRAVARFERAIERLGQLYGRLLALCLRRRLTTLVLALACLGGSLALFPRLGFEFLPASDEGRLRIEALTATGSSQGYTAMKMAQIAAIVEEMPEVTGIYTSVAGGSGAGANEARMEITLAPLAERQTPADAMVLRLRAALARIPGVTLGISSVGGVGGGGAPIELSVRGRDPVALSHAAERIAEMIAAIPGTAEVQLSAEAAQPLLDFRIQRDLAADFDVSPQAVGATLRTLIDGAEVSALRRADGGTDPVVLRLPEALRRDPAALGALPVARSGDSTLRLDQLTREVAGLGPARIDREARSRVITITAGLDGRVLGDVLAEIESGLAGLDLPEGIETGTGGDAEELGDTVASMAMALGMAVVCIYLVLASQFASFLQPLAIMAALPLALVGVMPALLLAGSTMNIYSMIGLVMLMGLVVKNSILLVDNANQQRRAGLALPEALVRAGTTRFRPILMTTLAMIFGMLPLALALHPGSAQSASMAQAVIGGLISGTLLTLVVVPVVLTWLEGFGQWLRGLRGAPPAPPMAALGDPS